MSAIAAAVSSGLSRKTVIAIASGAATHDIYDPINPADFDHVFRIGESVWGIKRFGTTVYVVCQGTELEKNGKFSLDGWEADFDFFPTIDPVLGTLHSGFNENTAALVAAIIPFIQPTDTVVFTGHSKGAGESPIGAARLYLAGYHNVQCALFAPPNPGMQDFADWIQAHIPGVAFRNLSDEIPDFGDPVPLLPPPPGVPCYPHKPICSPPDGWKYGVPTCWHDGALYDAVCSTY